VKKLYSSLIVPVDYGSEGLCLSAEGSISLLSQFSQ
jgi:hypothetical protein